MHHERTNVVWTTPRTGDWSWKEGEAPGALRRRKTRVSRIVHEMLNDASVVDGPKALEFNITANANADDCLRKVEQRVATLVARQLSVRSDQGSVHSGEDVV